MSLLRDYAWLSAWPPSRIPPLTAFILHPTRREECSPSTDGRQTIMGFSRNSSSYKQIQELPDISTFLQIIFYSGIKITAAACFWDESDKQIIQIFSKILYVFLLCKRNAWLNLDSFLSNKVFGWLNLLSEITENGLFTKKWSQTTGILLLH